MIPAGAFALGTIIVILVALLHLTLAISRISSYVTRELEEIDAAADKVVVAAAEGLIGVLCCG